MVERRGAKYGVKTNKTLKQSYGSRTAIRNHDGIVVEFAQRYESLEVEIAYSLDKKRRWEEYEVDQRAWSDSDKYDMNEKERSKKRERIAKNRDLKKVQNEVKHVHSKHERKLMKQNEKQQISSDLVVNDTAAATSVNEDLEGDKVVPIKQIGRKGYQTKDKLKYNVIPKSCFPSEEEYYQRLNSVEVWIPPTKRVALTHFAHDKKYYDDWLIDPILNKRKELKKEMIMLNKL